MNEIQMCNFKGVEMPIHKVKALEDLQKTARKPLFYDECLFYIIFKNRELR